jgi:dipeptidyl aminopeptidase/acylaminoacyl peptidase
MSIALMRPGDLRLDRRGGAVFSLAAPGREAGGSLQSRIWFVARGQGPESLTNSPGCDMSPTPSPVDDRTAFLSDRAEPGRFFPYLIDAGQVTGPLCTPDGTVEKLVWARDGAALFLLVADEGLDRASCDGASPLFWSAPEDPVVIDGQPRRRVLRLDMKSRQMEEIDARGFSVWEFDVGPDESILAVLSWDPTERGWHEARLARLTRQTFTTLLEPDEPLQCPAISPSGDMALILEGPASDRKLVAGTVRLIDLGTGITRRLAADHLDDLTHAAWLSDTVIGFSGWLGLGCRYGRVSTEGHVLSDHQEDAQLGPGRFAARVEQGAAQDVTIRESTGVPPEIALREGGEWHTLTAFNDGAVEGATGHTTTALEWRAPDGMAVSGLLLDPGTPAPGPLIVVVHGGPTASARCVFDPGGALHYVKAGYLVLLPNYRGSVGRGRAFTRAVIGDPAGADWADILSGVDYVVARGLAEPGRIGITGSSYGGYLSAWAAAVSDRFAAAVVVSGISDLLGCNYDCNHAFSEWVADGPVSDPQVRNLLIERSPLYNLDPAVTPTLLLHGERDRCTPIAQAQMMFRALRRRDTPARLVVFPREGHMIEENPHRERLSKEALDWFAEHLGAPS